MDNYSSSSFLGNMRYVNILFSTQVFHEMEECRCVGGASDQQVSVCLIVHCTCISSYTSM